MSAALPSRNILPVSRALFLFGVAYRLRRSRRLARAGRIDESERVADRLLVELQRYRERNGAPV